MKMYSDHFQQTTGKTLNLYSHETAQNRNHIKDCKYRHTKITNNLSAMNFSMRVIREMKRSDVAANIIFL
jgi:hypothetical protein